METDVLTLAPPDRQVAFQPALDKNTHSPCRFCLMARQRRRGRIFPGFPSFPFIAAVPLSTGIVQMLLLSKEPFGVFAIAPAPSPAQII